MEIERVNLQQVATVARLFNDYRMFYEQADDIAAAEQFLTARLLQEQSIIFMAIVNEEAAGFTQLYPTFSSVAMKKAFILNDLYVSADYRRQGIAEGLMNAAFHYANEENARFLTLETAMANRQAQALYEKMGMTADDEMKHYIKYW